jgi:chaperonin cofactor prefoldin
MELLKTDLHWHVRMAIVYRSERKKIIRNQINLVEKVLEDLEALIRYIGDAGKDINSEQLQAIIMKRASWEQKLVDSVSNDPEEERGKKLADLEDKYWYRRLVNAEYYKNISKIVF